MPEGIMIIAEVAQAHEGSLGMAHAFIDAAATAGADAIKFQTHIAEAESTPAEPWRVRFSQQDATRYDYWKRMEFTEGQWRGLKEHAEERELLFFSSPFSTEAADLLVRTGLDGWKIPSGEVGNDQLLERILGTDLPVILSSGMSSVKELDRTVRKIKAAGNELTVVQCTSMYPTPPEHLGLNVIPFLRERYGCKVGLSDHSGKVFAGLAAAALGSDVIEVHLTLSREAFGPDVPSSLTPGELHELVKGCAFIRTALENPVQKDEMAEALAPMRQIFTKSLVARFDLEAGVSLGPEHLAIKKPGTGLPPSKMAELLGRKLRRRVSADQLLAEEDFEPADFLSGKYELL